MLHSGAWGPAGLWAWSIFLTPPSWEKFLFIVYTSSWVKAKKVHSSWTLFYRNSQYPYRIQFFSAENVLGCNYAVFELLFFIENTRA